MPITKLINNFTGALTRDNTGDLNSGLAKYATTFGNDPFTDPGNLSWMEQAIAISNPDGVGIGTLCMAARVRLENVTYVYAVFDTGRLVKIAVNEFANPNFDNSVLITTLIAGTPSFQLGSSIQFYGATQKMFIGHDQGITKINFDGTGETLLALPSTNVPRPSANFLGKLYFGNGDNILEIDSTEAITTFTKLSPGFPSGTFVRDLDVSPDGNYLQITLATVTSPTQDQVTQSITAVGAIDSYRFLWNGTDTGYTSYETYNGYSLTSNTSFGPYSYTMGNDLNGGALYEGSQKIKSLPNITSPNFAAMFSTGNMLGFSVCEYNPATARMESSIFYYGQFDSDTPKGLFRLLRMGPVSGQDVVRNPVCLPVSNLTYGFSSSGYPDNIVGVAKLYFATLEWTQGSAYYNLFKFCTAPVGLGTAIQGVYETQQETSISLFRTILKERLKVYEVRVFTPPLVANNSFLIDVIGNDGNPIANASYTFTVGGNVTVGDTMVRYSPQMNPSYSIGLRITNLGTVNWVAEKIELDIDTAKA